MQQTQVREPAPQGLPFRTVMIDGAPWFHLRDILKATEHRPFFIRNSLLPLDGLRKFLHRSDKPRAQALLTRINALFGSACLA